MCFVFFLDIKGAFFTGYPKTSSVPRVTKIANLQKWRVQKVKVVATSLKAPIFTLEHLKVTLWETRFLDPVLCIHSKICVLLCSRAFIELFTKLTHPPRHLGPWPQTQPMSGVFRKGGLNRMLLFKTGVRRAHWLKLKIFFSTILPEILQGALHVRIWQTDTSLLVMSYPKDPTQLTPSI